MTCLRWFMLCVPSLSVAAPGLDKPASKPDEPKAKLAWYLDPPKPPPGAESSSASFAAVAVSGKLAAVAVKKFSRRGTHSRVRRTARLWFFASIIFCGLIRVNPRLSAAKISLRYLSSPSNRNHDRLRMKMMNADQDSRNAGRVIMGVGSASLNRLMAYQPKICSRQQPRKWPRGSKVSSVICPSAEFGRALPFRFL